MEKIACPGCGTEFFKPLIAADGSWRCLSCLKTFNLHRPPKTDVTVGKDVAASSASGQDATHKPKTAVSPPRRHGYGFWLISAWLLLGAIVLICGYEVYFTFFHNDYYRDDWFQDIFCVVKSFFLIGSAVLFLLSAFLAADIDRNFTRLLWNLGLWTREIPPVSGSNLPYILPTAVFGGMMIHSSMSAIVGSADLITTGELWLSMFYSAPHLQLFLGLAVMCVGFALSEILRFFHRLKYAALMVRDNPDFLKTEHGFGRPGKLVDSLLFYSIVWVCSFQLLAWIQMGVRPTSPYGFYILVRGVLTAGILISILLLTRRWQELLFVWRPVALYLRKKIMIGARHLERGRFQPKLRRGLFNLIAYAVVICSVCLFLLFLFAAKFERIRIMDLAAIFGFYFFAFIWMANIRGSMGYFTLPCGEDLRRKDPRRFIIKFAKMVSFVSAVCALLAMTGIAFKGFISPNLFIVVVSSSAVLILFPWFLGDVTADLAETASFLAAANRHWDEKQEARICLMKGAFDERERR